MFIKYFDIKEPEKKSKEVVIEFLAEQKIFSVDTSESIYKNYFMPTLKEMIDHLICCKSMLNKAMPFRCRAVYNFSTHWYFLMHIF